MVVPKGVILKKTKQQQRLEKAMFQIPNGTFEGF